MRAGRLSLLLLPAAAAVWLVGAKGVTLAPWAAVATTALVLIAVTDGARRGWPRHPGVAWLAMLTGWGCAAACFLPVARGEAAWLVAVAVVACGLALAAATPAGALGARRAVIVAGAVSSVWMIIERALQGGRPGGPVDDPNRAATVAVLALAVVPGSIGPRPLRGVTMAVLLAGVAASGSRAGLVALLVVLGVRLIAGTSRNWTRLAMVAAAVALVGLVVRLAVDRDPLRFERLKIWGVAVRTIATELPFGAGPGGYRDAAIGHNFPRHEGFARYHRIPALAENDGLQVASSLGLPGIIAAAGLLLTVSRRARHRRDLAGVLAALLVTSFFHSQLAVPLVAWTATLAVFSTWGRERFATIPWSRPALVSGVLLIAAVAAAALTWPRGGLLPDGTRWFNEAEAVLRAASDDPVALAGAEASAWRAAIARPRHPESWRLLGDLRLRRAALLLDLSLAQQSLSAYTEASRLNPLDVWAQLGLGRAHSLLGDDGLARASLTAATTLEPNCVPAWLELARVEVELGEIAAARRSLTRAEAALDRAREATFVSTYEEGMARPDPLLLARLRAVLEARR